MFRVSCLSTWWRHDIWISEKLKSEYLNNEKSLRSEMQNIFPCFKRAPFQIYKTKYQKCSRHNHSHNSSRVFLCKSWKIGVAEDITRIWFITSCSQLIASVLMVRPLILLLLSYRLPQFTIHYWRLNCLLQS